MELTHYNLDAFNALLKLRRDGRISWRALGLGMVIASFANKDTGESWPLRATLSAITGIDMRDISRTIRELEYVKFLTVSGRDGQSNIYRLTLGEIATLGDSATLGDLPPTLGGNRSKPLGDLPPIIIEEQSKNNEGSQNDEKPPSSSAPEADCPSPNSESKPKGNIFPQGNQPPSPAPSLQTTGKAKSSPKPKVVLTNAGFVVPDTIRRGWATAYPGVDIDREAAKAFAWCQNNPRRTPKKDFSRFLNGWMGRARPTLDPDENAVSDAELIHGAEMAFEDPDERADYWWQCECRGEYVPRGVDCRPMPDEKEVAV